MRSRCIPRLKVVALERVAARERRAVDALLARELLDFVSVHAEWLEGEVPGGARSTIGEAIVN